MILVVEEVQQRRIKYLRVGVGIHLLAYAAFTFLVAVYPHQLPIALLLALNFESIFLVWLAYRSEQRFTVQKPLSDGAITKLSGLWDIAHQGMRQNRSLRAEKALLTILKIDERNAAAYNRLGILYAKQKEYADAVDCFKIAVGLEPSASAFHNLGLIYYEIGDYKKSKRAFQKALELEDGLAARHIAYSKVLEKLDQIDESLAHLKKAYELDKTQKLFDLLYSAYKFHDKHKELNELLKAYAKTHPSDTLVMYKYGMKQISEAVEREQEAVDEVLARHGL
jgi:tetratricopeptide (TPR) repeat protein